MQTKVLKKSTKLNPSLFDILQFDPTLTDAMANFAIPALKRPKEIAQTENLKSFVADTNNYAFKIIKKSYLKHAPGTLTSNLGNLNIPIAYGDLLIERLIFIPLPHSTIPLYINGVTINNHMVFALSYTELKSDIKNQQRKNMLNIRNRTLEILDFK